MKRNYLLLLLIFVCMSVTAQLQRKFFDFRLGESTRNEVVRYYEKMGKQIIYRDDKIAVTNVRFGGEMWSMAIFAFYDNKLLCVGFSNLEEVTPKVKLDVINENLRNALKKKYSDYILLESETEISFRDKATKLALHYDVFQGTYNLSLNYYDLELLGSMAKDGLDEL